MKSKLKFLIIDDELDIIEVLNFYVIKYFEGPEIESTANPLEALELIKKGYFPDIIILDLNMPQLNGIELVKKLIELNSKLNIIIYSGAIGQYELVNNVSLGIKGVLEKPSAPEELRDEVVRILSEQNEENDFIQYDLSSALKLHLWPLDIYVLIGKNKYVKLFRSGDEIDLGKIDKMLQLSHVRYFIFQSSDMAVVEKKYAEIDILAIKVSQKSPCDIYSKNNLEYRKIISKSDPIIQEYLNILTKKHIKHLYVEEQFENLFSIIPENILILRINNAELTRKERVNALLNYADQKLEDLYNDPCEKSVLKVDYLSEQVSKYLSDDREALLDIINLKQDHDAKAHAINVATLSSAVFQHLESSLTDANADKRIQNFAKNFSFTPVMKKNIVLAGLLHDLETAFCNKEENENLTNPHTRSTNSHSAITLLSQIKVIPSVVLDMVDQHEERCDGSGPKKMYKPQINIYAQILIITDQYQICLSKGKTPQEALAEMFRQKEKFHEAVYQSLINLIVL